MSELGDKLADSLIPHGVRPYWTFRNMTGVALLAALASALVRGFVRFPPDQVARLEGPSVFRTPLFYSLYYLLVALVLWLVYATRHRDSWYLWRVNVYGMFLTGALVGIVDIVLPLRAS